MNVVCTKCNNELKLVQGKYGPFYSCSGYPDCREMYKVKEVEEALSGETPLADSETRDLRKEVYAQLAKIYNTSDAKEKADMFDFVKDNTEAGLISKLSKEEATKLLAQLVEKGKLPF